MKDLKIDFVYKFLFIFCGLISSCESMHPKVQAASNFNSTFSKYGKEKYHLTTEGMGGGWPDDTISFLSLSFCSDNFIDLTEARKLILALSDDMITSINSNTELQPWMKDQPSTVDNINLSISFKHDAAHADAIAMVIAARNRFNYYIYDLSTDNYKKVAIESVEEARQKLKEQEGN